jgi:transposase
MTEILAGLDRPTAWFGAARSAASSAASASRITRPQRSASGMRPRSLYGPLARRVDEQDPRPDRCPRPAARTDPDARPVAARLLGHLRQNTIVLADKAYDADWLRRQIAAAGAAPNIPPMIHRCWKPCFSPVLYRARNCIERFFNRIKHFRRLATRYEKHAANFLDMLKLAAIQLGCAIMSL